MNERMFKRKRKSRTMMGLLMIVRMPAAAGGRPNNFELKKCKKQGE
jgi:hypothetical protein